MQNQMRVVYSAEIAPINTVHRGVIKGRYTSMFPDIKEFKYHVPELKVVEETKKLSLVSMGGKFALKEVEQRLATLNLKPCEHGPNYLFGLMATFPADHNPVELENTRIVLAPTESFGIIKSSGGCIVGVICNKDPYERELYFFDIFAAFNEACIVVAEDINV